LQNSAILCNLFHNAGKLCNSLQNSAILCNLFHIEGKSRLSAGGPARYSINHVDGTKMGFTPGKKTKWGEGRKAFSVHADAIRAAIDQENPLRAVWLEYRERLGGLSYASFTRYVKRWARRAAAPDASTPAPGPERARTAAPPAPRRPPVREAPGGGHGQRQFHYDPNVDKDDLI
jgi:hypothetical protein